MLVIRSSELKSISDFILSYCTNSYIDCAKSLKNAKNTSFIFPFHFKVFLNVLFLQCLSKLLRSFSDKCSAKCLLN